MNKLLITTDYKKQIVDITDSINSQNDIKKISEGVCYLFIAHTTAALSVADLDEGTDLDMLDAFEKIIPKLNYRHPHNPLHVGDHIMSSIIGPSEFLFVKNGQLVLGSWQRVVLIELDGPRERVIYMKTLKDV